MKQTVRYTFLNIPQKLRCEVRLMLDDTRGNHEWISNNNGQQNVSLKLSPFIGLDIIRPQQNDGGMRMRAPWIPNDHLTLTKFTIGIMIDELKSIVTSLLIPEMYSYTGKRLELNRKLAEDHIRRFMVSNTAVEISPVVISATDQMGAEKLFEGVQLKFNVESSTVLLTVNELNSLIYNLDHVDVDSICLSLYQTYCLRQPPQYNQPAPSRPDYSQSGGYNPPGYYNGQ